MNQLQLRQTFGKFATGITVVTGVDEQKKPFGVTINSFSSVSLEPPLVSFCIGRNNKYINALSVDCYFVVNILSSSQQELSDGFANPRGYDFATIKHDLTAQGIPRFFEGLAVLTCQVRCIYPGGDHQIVVGEVLEHQSSDGQPLLYFSGGYRTL